MLLAADASVSKDGWPALVPCCSRDIWAGIPGETPRCCMKADCITIGRLEWEMGEFCSDAEDCGSEEIALYAPAELLGTGLEVGSGSNSACCFGTGWGWGCGGCAYGIGDLLSGTRETGCL